MLCTPPPQTPTHHHVIRLGYFTGTYTTTPLARTHVSCGPAPGRFRADPQWFDSPWRSKCNFYLCFNGMRGGDRVRIDCPFIKVKRTGQLGSIALKATGGNTQGWSFANLEGRLGLGNVTAVFTSGRIDLAPLTCSWIWLEASLPLCTTLIQISLMLHCRPSLDCRLFSATRSALL